MITAPSSRLRRPAALLAAAATAAMVLSGCDGTTNPITTLIDYAPADGIQMDGSAFDVRDLLVVSHGNGSPAVVSGTVVNSGTEPVTVTVSVAGQQLEGEVTVDPGAAVRLDGVQPDGTEDDPVTVPALETPAGQGVEVRISDSQETLAGKAPVLLPQGPYEQFADLAGGPVEQGDADAATETGDH